MLQYDGDDDHDERDIERDILRGSEREIGQDREIGRACERRSRNG